MQIIFAQRLRSLRKLHGKRQQIIADTLGITRPAYCAYETGKREPDFTKLAILARYFSVFADYLLGIDHLPNHQGSTEQAQNKIRSQYSLIMFINTR